MNRPQFAGLDGLRALAIGLVIVCHAAQSYGFPEIPLLADLAKHGAFGVEIFFVLSGFLITSLLIREESQSGVISLSDFYRRRAFRILPASLFYLGFLFAGARLGWFDISGEDFLACLFLYRGWIDGSLETGHFWTLALEEQFYLLWPLFLVWVPSRVTRFRWVLALLVIAPLWRHFNLKLFGADGSYAGRLDVRYDSLLMGCFFAILRESAPTQFVHYRDRLEKSAIGRFALWPAIAILIATQSPLTSRLPGFLSVWNASIAFLSIALIIDRLVENRAGGLGQLLETPMIRWIGRLSYSLYLWQQIFLLHRPEAIAPAWYQVFPLNLALVFVAASISYYFIERPFLKIRDRKLVQLALATRLTPKM